MGSTEIVLFQLFLHCGHLCLLLPQPQDLLSLFNPIAQELPAYRKPWTWIDEEGVPGGETVIGALQRIGLPILHGPPQKAVQPLRQAVEGNQTLSCAGLKEKVFGRAGEQQT